MILETAVLTPMFFNTISLEAADLVQDVMYQFE
jgi:hypothetical protein